MFARYFFTRCCLVLLAVCCVYPVQTFAQPAQPALTAEKRADIETFLELTDALALGVQLSQAFTAQIANVMRSANPPPPDGVIEAMQRIVDELIGESLPELTDSLVELYDRHFTHEEIRGFNAFYASELGRKAIAVLPQITQESMAMGQLWGQSLQPEIDRRLRAWMVEQGGAR